MEIQIHTQDQQGAGHVIILPRRITMAQAELFILVVVEGSITSTVMVIKHMFLKGDDVTYINIVLQFD